MGDRLVLYGGTFDPVHCGHLLIARAVAEARGYERITFVPAASPPHKAPAQAGGDERIEMLRRVAADDDLFDVCDLEIRRPGKSYTFDTLAALRDQRGREVELHWIIGADMLADLPKWRRAAEVLDLAQIVIALRPPWHERIEGDLDGVAARLGAERAAKLRAAVVRTPLLEISSSAIRQRVARGLPIRYLVPPAVEEFIRQRGLYRSEM